jgi:histidine phosphotransfer protein HptB
MNPTALMPPNVIDMRLIDNIRSLNTDGRPDLLAELVTIFRQTTPDLLKSLDDAIGRVDVKMIGRIAHRLKGASGNVGAKQMSRVCAELEMLAKSAAQSPSDFKRYASAVQQSYSEALSALEMLM